MLTTVAGFSIGALAADLAGVPIGSEASLTVEKIEHILGELEQDSELDVETRLQAIDNYKAALKNLLSARDFESEFAANIAETESLPARVVVLKKQLADLKEKKATVATGLPLQEMEQQLPQIELQLSTQKKNRQAAELEPQARTQRRKDIRARMAAIEERLVDARSQVQAMKNAVESPLSVSLRSRLVSRQSVLVQELQALETELAKYDIEESADLVRLRTDVAVHSAALLEKEIALVQQQIAAARDSAAAHSVRQARQAAIDAAPSLKVYASRNQELAEKAKLVADQLAKAEQDLQNSIAVHESLAREFMQTRRKVELVGLTSSVGSLLRKQKSNLPPVSQRRLAVIARQSLINENQYELFEYEEERQRVVDPSLLAADVADSEQTEVTLNSANGSVPTRGNDPAPGNAPTSVLVSATEELVTRKTEYLDTLIRSSGQYFDTLIELDTIDQQIIKLAAEYASYIDQRVLWIRSGRALTAQFRLGDLDYALISPATWSRAAMTVVQDLARAPWAYALIAAMIGVLMYRGRTMRCRLKRYGEIAAKPNCRNIMPTIQSLFFTTLLSVGWPIVITVLGWRLLRIPGEDPVVLGFGRGLICVGLLLAALEWLRQMCRPFGLAESHFQWSTGPTRQLRRFAQSLALLSLPLAFTATALSQRDQPPGHDSLERVVFIAGMIVVAYCVFGLLKPSGILKTHLNEHESGWVSRLRWVWPLLGSSVPLFLACLTLVGYHYTSEVLFWRLFSTVVFVVGVTVLRSLLFRLLQLRRRNLSIDQSRQRAAAAGVSSEPNNSVTNSIVGGIVTDDPKADMLAHSVQSRRLISAGTFAGSLVGLWMIWVQVLPALSMLDSYPVWPSAGTSSVASTTMSSTAAMMPMTDSGESTPSFASDENIASVVTVSDLALAVLIGALTFVISRNGPGLLEISVLQQLPLDASVRYAITTLVSYVIMLVGTITTCSTIGLQWSQIQWLATALTFGLAFGLQEMFANFVAGLIILLERPIRVGDVVTVDDVTGVVSKIRIRATSITNWDRKEYVVPNKEFITGRLLNWTLSDKVNRIVIEVGIAYGSDTDHAHAIMLKVANDHPLILKDPPSVAAFEGFGDSSLKLVLRTYLPTMDNRLEVIHQLHTSIDKAFRAAKIEIAFPQRDLHVRSLQNELGLSLDETTSQRREAA